MVNYGYIQENKTPCSRPCLTRQVCHCQDNEVIVVARRHRKETKMGNGIFNGPEGAQDWKCEFPPSKMVDLAHQKVGHVQTNLEFKHWGLNTNSGFD